jgi:hypothetical protein
MGLCTIAAAVTTPVDATATHSPEADASISE